MVLVWSLSWACSQDVSWGDRLLKGWPGLELAGGLRPHHVNLFIGLLHVLTSWQFDSLREDDPKQIKAWAPMFSMTQSPNDTLSFPQYTQVSQVQRGRGPHKAARTRRWGAGTAILEVGYHMAAQSLTFHLLTSGIYSTFSPVLDCDVCSETSQLDSLGQTSEWRSLQMIPASASIWLQLPECSKWEPPSWDLPPPELKEIIVICANHQLGDGSHSRWGEVRDSYSGKITFYQGSSYLRTGLSRQQEKNNNNWEALEEEQVWWIWRTARQPMMNQSARTRNVGDEVSLWKL